MGSHARLVALAGALAASLAGTSASASPQEVIGFGFRSLGMGNTGAAIGQGVDTVYANPALLSTARDMELQLGTMGAHFDLSASGPGLAQPLVAYPSLQANTIGGVLPLPFGGALKDRVAIGVGFLTPFDVVVRGRILYPEKPQYLIADRVQSVAVQAGLGIDIGYGIRIGGGFAALAALAGSVVVATDDAGRLGTTVQDTLVASYMPIVGASWEFADDNYRVGVTYRGELVGRFNVIIEAENLGQITIPPLNISGVAQYDPWQIAAEVARVKGDWRVAVGLTYKHWPAYAGPVEATVRCPPAVLDDAPCDPLLPPDPGLSPVVSPRAGVERMFEVGPTATIGVRGGYAFEPSPFPEQTGLTSYFDNHRSVFSLGYGLSFTEPIGLSFDGFAQVQWLHARRHDKSRDDGALLDGVVNTSGAILAGGTSASVRF